MNPAEFAKLMQQELCVNASKGDFFAWAESQPDNLESEIDHHLVKLKLALRQKDRLAIREYAADLGNYAMAASDLLGALMRLTPDQEQLMSLMPFDGSYARTIPQRGRGRAVGSSRWTEVRAQLRRKGIIEAHPGVQAAMAPDRAGDRGDTGAADMTTVEIVSMLNFQPALKAPNRLLCHTEIGQLAVIKDAHSKKWIVRHNGVRISKVDHARHHEAIVEAGKHHAKACGLACVTPTQGNLK